MDFYTPLQVKFIREIMQRDPKNEEYLQYKFYYSFICPRLEDELILARYNPDNICDIDAELGAELYDMELDEYLEHVNTAKESFAESAFEKFVKNVRVNSPDFEHRSPMVERTGIAQEDVQHLMTDAS